MTELPLIEAALLPAAYLTWRETVLPGPHCLPLPPQPHSIVYLLSSCFCGAGLGYLLQSVPLPARKNTSAFAHSAHETAQG